MPMRRQRCPSRIVNAQEEWQARSLLEVPAFCILDFVITPQLHDIHQKLVMYGNLQPGEYLQMAPLDETYTTFRRIGQTRLPRTSWTMLVRLDYLSDEFVRTLYAQNNILR